MLYSCIGRTSAEPFFLKNTNIGITSIEELCWYVQSNVELMDESIMDTDLIRFIDEALLCHEIAGELKGVVEKGGGVSDFVTVLLDMTHFVDDAQMANIRSRLLASERMSPFLRHMLKGNSYLDQGLSSIAVFEYEEALMCDPEEESPSSLARVYHNMGVVYARLFCFEKAALLFRKALDLAPYAVDSYEQYLACYRLSLPRDEYIRWSREKQVDVDMAGRLEDHIDKAMGEVGEREDEKLYSECAAHNAPGDEDALKGSVLRLLKKFKEDYRNGSF